MTTSNLRLESRHPEVNEGRPPERRSTTVWWGDDGFGALIGQDKIDAFQAFIDTLDRLEEELNKAEVEANKALSRYKFQMFGYWAAIWVHLNRIGGFKRPNPWGDIATLTKGRV